MQQKSDAIRNSAMQGAPNTTYNSSSNGNNRTQQWSGQMMAGEVYDPNNPTKNQKSVQSLRDSMSSPMIPGR